MSNVIIANKLQVLPSNMVLIPGCEPSSTLTSPTMSLQMRLAGLCQSAIIPLEDALELIPEARVILLANFGGPTRKLLQLPDNAVSCPCSTYEDYYAILRAGARPITADDVDDILDESCGVIDQGFCRGLFPGE